MSCFACYSGSTEITYSNMPLKTVTMAGQYTLHFSLEITLMPGCLSNFIQSCS